VPEWLTNTLVNLAFGFAFGYAIGIARALKAEKALLEAENEHLYEENEKLKGLITALDKQAMELKAALDQQPLR